MNNKAAGFTLVELVVTVMLAALVMTLGVPSFNNIIRSNRLATQGNDLVSVFNFARSEAIKRNMSVSVCRTSAARNFNACDDDSYSAWSQPEKGAKGLMVYRDTDLDGSIADDEIFQVYPDFSDRFELVSSLDSDEIVIFNSRGYASAGEGQFLLCDRGLEPTERNTQARAVVINAAGRVSVEHKMQGSPLSSNPRVSESCV